MTAPAPAVTTLISADSHVMEPHDLWETRLPAAMSAEAPRFPAPKVGEGFQGQPGGHDPHARLEEMSVDNVSVEVLYPTLTLSLFDLDDARLQEAFFRIYNDWLIEYCTVSPERLVGLAAVAAYDVDHAVAELTRCARAGLRGALVWQAPHPDLPFAGNHYDRLWAAAQELRMPISMHILTGHSYHKGGLDRGASQVKRGGLAPFRGAVNLKIADAAGAIFELVYSGVLERFPELKIVSVETEMGWLPFTATPRPIRQSASRPARTCVARCTPRSSTIPWARASSPGGARTPPCGPTTFPIPTAPGPTLRPLSTATSAICRRTCKAKFSGRMLRGCIR
jgi:predicted TIM-barrel fold metal-dependent hydrolase